MIKSAQTIHVHITLLTGLMRFYCTYIIHCDDVQWLKDELYSYADWSHIFDRLSCDQLKYDHRSLLGELL